MWKVENSKELSIYKSVKRAGVAGARKQERSLRWAWRIGKRLAFTGSLGEVKNLDWILFHSNSNEEQVDKVGDVSDKKNHLCHLFCRPEHDKDDLDVKLHNAWTEGILVRWLIPFHMSNNYWHLMSSKIFWTFCILLSYSQHIYEFIFFCILLLSYYWVFEF